MPGSAVWFRIDDRRGHLAAFASCRNRQRGCPTLAAGRDCGLGASWNACGSWSVPVVVPSAILMADLEASSPLARRLSTAQYFAFVRRLVRAADDASSMRAALSAVTPEMAWSRSSSPTPWDRNRPRRERASRRPERCADSLAGDRRRAASIPEPELSLRFGLHWGATLYMGRILTAGRSEVTGFGDEVNEAARIEACATGGRALASKSLIERLTADDAEALGLDTAHMTYTPLAELATATDKARRDASSIAVCEV